MSSISGAKCSDAGEPSQKNSGTLGDGQKVAVKKLKWYQHMCMCSIFKNMCSSRDEGEPSQKNSDSPHVFDYKELKKVTNNFGKVLGEGGFGIVYYGKLTDGKEVAVKKLKMEDNDDDHNQSVIDQYENEVANLAPLRHKNLIVLYGYVNYQDKELFLIYEYVPNGNVSEHLHGGKSFLTWPTRIQIALETAETLKYLHSRDPPILHRDMKTPNILLDNDLHVKVADLGSCRRMPTIKTVVWTTPQGTVGCTAPEYDHSYQLTDRADVYRFGVVLLELVSGLKALDVERPIEDMRLYSRVNEEGFEMEKFIDSKINYNSNYDVTRMVDSVFKLAVKCLNVVADMRPSMSMVLRDLESISRNEVIDSEVQLPEDYEEILSGAVTPVEFSSQYDLYCRLCGPPILIDKGMMTFSLERLQRAKCYTLSARKLKIKHLDEGEIWKWEPHPDSRFPVVATLMRVYWLEMRGKLNCNLLSKGTNYAAFLIFKLEAKTRGLSIPWKASVKLGSQTSMNDVCLNPEANGTEMEPHRRPDGWLEMELGGFFNNHGNEGDLEIRVWELPKTDMKATRKTGVIIEGIEVRPKEFLLHGRRRAPTTSASSSSTH